MNTFIKEIIIILPRVLKEVEYLIIQTQEEVGKYLRTISIEIIKWGLKVLWYKAHISKED